MKKRIASLIFALTLVVGTLNAPYVSASEASLPVVEAQEEGTEEGTSQKSNEDITEEGISQESNEGGSEDEVLPASAIQDDAIEENQIVSEDSETDDEDILESIEGESAEEIQESIEEESAEEILVSFEHEETIDGYTISLYAAEGVFPKGTLVQIVKVSQERAEEIEEIVDEQLTEEQSITKVVAFDITFFDEDMNEIEPEEGSVIVSVFLSSEIKEAVEEAEAPSVEVFHIDEEDNAQMVSSDVTDEVVEFEAEVFTEYVIVVTDGVIGGQVTDTISWKLMPDTKVLSVTGTGDMPEFGYSYYEGGEHKTIPDAPWENYKLGVKAISISEGITSIGMNAFSGCRNAEGNLVIPSTV
ncbi:MAG: hypothetical protein HUJ70_03690, partial [Pseudobutyrivibrio sp.]|nr:hypothetical protein [Pseudobutyrivibrio sp.]